MIIQIQNEEEKKKNASQCMQSERIQAYGKQTDLNERESESSTTIANKAKYRWIANEHTTTNETQQQQQHYTKPRDQMN